MSKNNNKIPKLQPKENSQPVETISKDQLIREMRKNIYAGFIYPMEELIPVYELIKGEKHNYTIKRCEIQRLICNYFND